MRRFILIALLIAACHCGQGDQAIAQKVHALVVGDLSPSAGWGKYTANVAMDLTSMYVILHENLPESNIDYRNIEIETDSDSNPSFLLSAIQSLRPAPNDTVFFYFTGHGAVDDKGHYLALARGKLYRQTIIDSLLRKKPRLAVIITDCCNARSDGYLVVAAAPGIEEPRQVSSLFKSLMMEPNGIVDINSCSPGESAFFTPLDEESDQLPGSIFSRELGSWMREHQKQRSSWEALVHSLSIQVHTAFKAYYPKGAQIAKGQSVQNQQTVYAIAYPGKPKNEGPRTGLVARDFEGLGAIIIDIVDGSPATQVYDIKTKTFLSLRAQQVLISANGKTIEKADDWQKIVNDSPQIIRIGVRDAKTGDHEYLMRLRY